MRTIGLIGGMSWESTDPYYRLINEGVRARLGGLHSAELLIRSVDFAPIESLLARRDWDALAAQLGAAGHELATAGADFLVLATNTMHRVADEISAAAGVPLLHIADATGEAVRAARLGSVGLLGTRATMEEDFYRGRLNAHFGLQVITPGPSDRELIDAVIFDELCRGEVRPESRTAYRAVIDDLVARGAEGVILGCTEIGLLIGPDDASVPLFDTTALHAAAAVERALAG